MTIRFQPLADRLLVQRLEADARTRGGIVLPDSARKKSQLCRVLAVGPGKFVAALNGGQGGVVPVPVQSGDTVLVQEYAGAEVKVEGVDRTYVISEGEVLARVDGDGA